MCSLMSFEKCINSSNQHPYQDMVHFQKVPFCSLSILEFPTIRIIHSRYPSCQGSSFQCFWNSHMLLCISTILWFSLLNDILSCGYYTICLSTLLSTDIWVIKIWDCYKERYYGHFGAGLLVDPHFHFSWVKTQEWIAGYKMWMFNF